MSRTLHRNPSIRRKPGRKARRLTLEVLEARTLLDGGGPRIVGHAAGVQGEAFVDLSVTFGGPIDPGSFTAADVSIAGPGGPIAATGVDRIAGNTYRITIPPLSAEGT